MEDYKQKYEQALEYMCKVYPTLNGTDKEDAEHYFSELKESEDERIRKAIVNHLLELSKSRVNLMTKETYENWIAWLEKQGEHANFRNKIQIGDEVTRNEDGVLVNLSQFKRMVKQGEQKLTWSEEDKLKMDTLIHVITNQKGSAIFEDLLPEELVHWLKSLKERLKGK